VAALRVRQRQRPRPPPGRQSGALPAGRAVGNMPHGAGNPPVARPGGPAGRCRPWTLHIRGLPVSTT
jgi:hypothetical protein